MAVDFLLKFDSGSGITGESVIDKHEGEVQILSWSWGGVMSTSVSGSGGSSAGKAQLSEFSFMKETDKGTPSIYKALVSGTHIKQVDLFAMKTGGGSGAPFQQFTFKEVLITSYQVSASSEVPTESVSFSYANCQMQYWNQDAEGTMTVAGNVTFDTRTQKVS